MIKTIDSLLNKITMYRLVVYELLFLLFAAGILSYLAVLPYSPIYLAYSTALIFCICWITNKIFASLFEAPSNPESTWITALVLALIITPPATWLDMQYLPLAFWAAALAIASKYILAIRNKHVFNPVVVGVALTSLVLGFSASWWVGTLAMIPFTLAGGVLIVRKLHRFDLWWAFLATFVAGDIYFNFYRGLNLFSTLNHSLLYTSAFFFATVMLTEPATTPPARLWRIFYGAMVGLLFLPNIHIGSFYLTPELALLAGNLFSYLISPKQKLVLKLKRAMRLSPDVYEFAFATNKALSYKPGQYLEWTLAHGSADSRSVRRYFTLASSPTEPDIKLGVRFNKPPSTFKKAMLSLREGQSIVASQLAGDFVLSNNPKKKLVFIAGGIGVTPFRSMIQYLLDKQEKRPITMLYYNKTPADVVYADIFDRAERELGIKTIYTFTDDNTINPRTLPIFDVRTIAQEVPDYMERTFYISGPQGLVASFRNMLLGMGISRTNIKTDYFPGFA